MMRLSRNPTTIVSGVEGTQYHGKREVIWRGFSSIVSGMHGRSTEQGHDLPNALRYTFFSKWIQSWSECIVIVYRKLPELRLSQIMLREKSPKTYAGKNRRASISKCNGAAELRLHRRRRAVETPRKFMQGYALSSTVRRISR